MTVIRIAAVLFALGAAPAGAQGVPEPLRGPWFAGGCAAPVAMLHLTARAAARLPATGAARLWRFGAVGPAPGWTVATAGGPEAPRLLLRQAGDALETAEPAAKTRDDQLPGPGIAAETWTRCATPPALAVLLHGEGLAGLAALEALEAGCAGPAASCAEALVAAADVTRDGALTAAELARLGRGLAWVIAAQAGAEGGDLGAAVGLGALASLAISRALVDSLDYDGDGRLSAVELGQDRVGFGAAPGTAAGAPLPLEAVGPAIEALRGLISGMELPR